MSIRGGLTSEFAALGLDFASGSLNRCREFLCRNPVRARLGCLFLRRANQVEFQAFRSARPAHSRSMGLQLDRRHRLDSFLRLLRVVVFYGSST